MKGILKKTNKEWVVSYFDNSVKNHQLPLYKNTMDTELTEGKKVEFEEVLVFTKTGQCMEEVEGFNILKANIIVKEPQENWDEIFQDYDKNSYQGALRFWLKRNYLPPKKKL